MWTVRYLAEAEQELDELPGTEQAAIRNAEAKLAALGPMLPHPHSSDVRGSEGLRELRPRSGRCKWRALYQRSGDTFWIAAVCPEAEYDPRGFTRGCADALRRLKEEPEN